MVNNFTVKQKYFGVPLGENYGHLSFIELNRDKIKYTT